MAENGQFRNAFRGFNKQDVLTYIDQLQVSLMARVEDAQYAVRSAQVRADELEAELSETRETAQQASANAEMLATRVCDLRSQSEKLTKLAQAYKNELLELREKLAESEKRAANQEELQVANARVAELERENALLKQQNEQYAHVVGDIHRVMMKARVISASYFETAHKNTVDCLGQLDSFLDDLKAQVASNMTASNTLHEESEDRIDDLFSQLK